ncbi:glycerol-3-phosphate regulon repressor [Xanthomonas citri pv. aurantifolii str. ICPB 10535]|nr:glycerol-3-phosphate regulon repressor [Xanthomonas citri pv. aurantifolii str. ICPB 10535]
MRDHLRMESTHYRTVPAPALNPRQEQLVALVRQQGFAEVEGLATRFEVTPQTIRRDLTLLCDAGVLRRYHGGVSMPSSVENLAYTARKALQAREKQHIAARVARFIPDDASLFINLGTTNEEVARALLQHRGLRVITNNLNVAVMLSANPSFEVIVAGGVVRGRDQGVTGEATVELIRQFKVDFGGDRHFRYRSGRHPAGFRLPGSARGAGHHRTLATRAAGRRSQQIRSQRHGAAGRHRAGARLVHRPAAAAGVGERAGRGRHPGAPGGRGRSRLRPMFVFERFYLIAAESHCT